MDDGRRGSSRSFASGSIITFYESAYSSKVTEEMHFICRGCGATLWAIWRTNSRYGFTACCLRQFRRDAEDKRGDAHFQRRTFAGIRAIGPKIIYAFRGERLAVSSIGDHSPSRFACILTMHSRSAVVALAGASARACALHVHSWHSSNNGSPAGRASGQVRRDRVTRIEIHGRQLINDRVTRNVIGITQCCRDTVIPRRVPRALERLIPTLAIAAV